MREAAPTPAALVLAHLKATGRQQHLGVTSSMPRAMCNWAICERLDFMMTLCTERPKHNICVALQVPVHASVHSEAYSDEAPWMALVRMASSPRSTQAACMSSSLVIGSASDTVCVQISDDRVV